MENFQQLLDLNFYWTHYMALYDSQIKIEFSLTDKIKLIRMCLRNDKPCFSEASGVGWGVLLYKDFA